ncbi:hypothetical protein GR183_17495 [Stappia sp. GBMRC 2046]|uniref:Uncharacterized protein n=1 Tax=Stappia sediminis TaxID=2692190 RepID=A0A7X3LX66_9HYPH|nr:hypothetical protein [Stappia sediminis]MXN66712.1 hypothetical protein [Stappia sediminis]
MKQGAGLGGDDFPMYQQDDKFMETTNNTIEIYLAVSQTQYQDPIGYAYAFAANVDGHTYCHWGRARGVDNARAAASGVLRIAEEAVLLENSPRFRIFTNFADTLIFLTDSQLRKIARGKKVDRSREDPLFRLAHLLPECLIQFADYKSSTKNSLFVQASNVAYLQAEKARTAAVVPEKFIVDDQSLAWMNELSVQVD